MKIKKKHVNKFLKLTTELDNLLKEIREYNPEANYYVACDTINLMNGASHGNRCESQPENVVESKYISGLDSGDW